MVKQLVLKKKGIQYPMLYDDFNQSYIDCGSVGIGGDGYAILDLNGKKYRLNKLFMFGFENYDLIDKNITVDHVNRNILDNRMENLRITNKQLNEYNEKPLRRNNRSGYKGVYWDKDTNSWCAQIMYNGHSIKIGRYKEIADAIKMRLRAEILFCGEEHSPQRHLFISYKVYSSEGLPDRVFKLKEKYEKESYESENKMNKLKIQYERRLN